MRRQLPARPEQDHPPLQQNTAPLDVMDFWKKIEEFFGFGRTGFILLGVVIGALLVAMIQR
jgi:hypothetical protein